METLMKKNKKNGREKSLKSCALLFSFMVLFTINVMGTVNAGISLPSSKDDEKVAIAELQHQELMNYIYMALGFGVILGVAWFTVIGKKKRATPEDVEKNHVIKHRHSTYEKRYGASRSHG